MNVKQLKACLEGVPDNMEVMIPDVEGDFEFTFPSVAEVREIKFSEGTRNGPRAKDNVFIIE